MKEELHVVLGATGAVGRSVVEELQLRGYLVRAVERSKRFRGIETIHADLNDEKQTIQALEGASHVYVCIGLPYNTMIWEEQWPRIIGNIIQACQQHKARMIFLDNIYMYGPSPLDVPFTENHERNPDSKKGKTRQKIAEMVMEAHRVGRIEAVIGRSADFYGPYAMNSLLYTTFVVRMLDNKSPQAMGGINVPRTYSYTKDNGRALVALALSSTTYGQEWHLPVSHPITFKEIVTELNDILGTNLDVTIIPRVVLKIMGLVIPIIKESNEMLYQIDAPYIMSDQKFRKQFPDFEVTRFDVGMREMVRSFQV